MRFTFDVDRHIYRVDGQIKRSVSKIVTLDQDVDATRFYTEESRWRGSRVHRDTLELDLDSFDGSEFEEDALLVQSYKRWRDLVNPIWTSIEEARYSAIYDYCGAADRVGYDGMKRPLVADLKTGQPAKWHPLQLALYDLLHDDMPPRIRRRVCIYLQKDGTRAKGVEFKDPTDYDRALQLLRKAA